MGRLELERGSARPVRMEEGDLEPAGDSGRVGRDPGPVIGGLRIGGDEVQFARVLAEICGEKPSAAKTFAQAVMKAAGADYKPKGSVRCDLERGVVRYGRGTIHRQAKKLGSVDLLFTDKGDMRLYCELKINASYQPGQIPKYLEGGKASHVVGVVRRPSLKDTVTDKRWLGEVTWGQIAKDLQALPLPSAHAREQWLDLLALMQADEDFSSVRPAMPLQPILSSSRTLSRERSGIYARGCEHRTTLARLGLRTTSLRASRTRPTKETGRVRRSWIGRRRTTSTSESRCAMLRQALESSG